VKKHEGNSNDTGELKFPTCTEIQTKQEKRVENQLTMFEKLIVHN